MIDYQTAERIKSVADIVEVISDFVSLRKSGTNYKCICPFHNEKTPSFMVSPSKGIFKCFSCGAGGDAIRFLMLHEQLSYPDALRWLAKKYGIEIQEKDISPEELNARNLRSSLFIVNNWACEYFQNNLYNTPDGQSIGMSYFRKRGFRDDIIKKFQLGYSLAISDALSSAAVKSGYNLEHLEKNGLCYKLSNGKERDRFQGRVIFPVHALDGKIVAFGGRVLNTEKQKDVAKYVNSPESEIYLKRNELYGIYLGKKAIQKNDQCYLVEGYTDVISMHQCGIENVVASSGTSLTYEQIHLIRRFTKNLTVLYDGDMAGIKASLRGINMLLEEGMNIKVLLLPDGDDPDSFARKHSAEEYVEYINSHQVDFIHFKIGILLNDCGNDPYKRGAVVNDIIESISLIPDTVVRAYYIKECSGLLGVDEILLINKTKAIRIQHKEDLKKHKEQEERRLQYAKESSNISNAKKNDSEIVEEDTKQPILQAPNQNNIQPPTLIYQREYALIKAIIKYGERMMGYAEEGVTSVSVLQFIRNEMETDELIFQTPLFERIMQECINQMECKSNFIPSDYFAHHENTEYVELAATMLADRYSIGTTDTNERKLTEDMGNLNHTIPLMVVDLKWAIVTTQIKEILTKLQSSSLSETDQSQMMAQYQEFKKIQSQLKDFLSVK